MATQSPRPTTKPTEAETALKRNAEERAAVWGFVWTLFAFKIATVCLIAYASHSFRTGMILFVTTWAWVIIPVFAISGPILFRLRLLKQRARRAELQRAEWLVDDPNPSSPASPPSGHPPR